MMNAKVYLQIGVLIARVVVSLVVLAVVDSSVAMTGTDDEAAVRGVLMESTLSFEKNDVAMATKVWANDASLTVFESGHANYGWADYRDNHLVPEMAEMKNTKYVLADLKIHIAGKTAWATFKYTISADIPDKGKTRHVEGSGLGTAVLEQRSGRWQIVHWHSSAPRRAPAPAAKPD
jgi:ketosteroid isomerase-like protein